MDVGSYRSFALCLIVHESVCACLFSSRPQWTRLNGNETARAISMVDDDALSAECEEYTHTHTQHVKQTYVYVYVCNVWIFAHS